MTLDHLIFLLQFLKSDNRLPSQLLKQLRLLKVARNLLSP